MKTSERLAVIRAKCGSKQIAKSTPKRPRYAGLIVRGSDKPTAYGIGPRLSAPDRVVAWVAEPEERVEEWMPKRRHAPHALTRIAERLRRK
jgi:hypothetical protein